MNDVLELRRFPLFAELKEETFRRLAGKIVFQKYEAGEQLFRQGEEATCLFVVLDGWIKYVRVDAGGAETIVDIVTSGRSLGETVALCGGAHQCTAEAATPARLARSPAAAVREIMRTSPDLAIAVARMSEDWISALIRGIERSKHQSLDERLARLILSLCPSGNGNPAFDLPYEKGLIAAQLGVNQASLSRCLKRLRDIGVNIGHRRVEIESLENFVREIPRLRRDGPRAAAEMADSDA